MDKHNRYGGDKKGLRPSERQNSLFSKQRGPRTDPESIGRVGGERKGPRTDPESIGQVGGGRKGDYGRVRKRQEAERVRLERERQEAERQRQEREHQNPLFSKRRGPRTDPESISQVG